MAAWRLGRALCRALLIALPALAATCGAWAAKPVPPAGLCADAIQAAQARYAVPTGLLFASKAEAIQWVQAAQAKGVASIDIGCMQVNLMYHPDAFAALDDAFDPGHNADYAARFLVSLHATTGDWQQAAGLYHSQTQALAIPYAEKVEDALNGRPWGGSARLPAPPPKPTVLAMLQQAWGATLAAPAAAAAAPQASSWSALLPPRPVRRVVRPRRRQMPVLLSYAH